MTDKFHLTVAENIFLAKKLLVENIYNTAKLEGVNTTFLETQAILDGVNIPGAKLDDIQVILNLRDAWRDVLAALPDAVIDLEFIMKINGNVSRNESLAWGELRTGAIGISGTNHRPGIPDAQTVATQISTILSDDTKSATERAIDLMVYTMYNQLFWAGNKRTANLAANAMLIQNGAGVLSISPDNLPEFNRLLKQYYDTGEADELTLFLHDVAVVDFATKHVSTDSSASA